MEQTEQKESFVMYGSFLEAAEDLPGDEFKDYVLKLRDYALKGIYEPSEYREVNRMLIMARPNIKSAAKRWEDAKNNGNKGKEHG